MSSDYYSFLLKIWVQNPQNGERIWRASLQSPKSGGMIGFKSLSELAKYLEKLTDEDAGEDHEDRKMM